MSESLHHKLFKLNFDSNWSYKTPSLYEVRKGLYQFP